MPRRLESSREAVRAAQYLRMSTEHQRYSTELQAAEIARYAENRGYQIVRTYADDGISGVSIKSRKGLQRLLADVVGGEPGYDVVLVYDVSRWGRFQNPDQSAHYEFLCADAGVPVEYCAEQFPNDGSLSSTLLKSLRRAMAAEYSRELSVKVSAGLRKSVQMGFWHGGPAGYGLRRQIVGPDGTLGAVLQYGQGKAIQGCHSILVPGPADEVAVVQRIYRMFAVAGINRTRISAVLNAEGVLAEAGCQWSWQSVTQVLSNPKYVGDLVGFRTRAYLGARRERRQPSDWEWKRGAFEPIVSRRLFDTAKRILDARPKRLTRDEMIEGLRRVYDQHGKLSCRLIDEAPGVPPFRTYCAIFGGLPVLCGLIGQPGPDRLRRRRAVNVDPEQALRRLAALYIRCGYLSCDLINQDGSLPCASTYGRLFGGMDKAYARIGYVQLTLEELRSPVGRARAAAASVRLRAMIEERQHADRST